MQNLENKISNLREAIQRRALVRKNQQKIVSRAGRESNWLLDIRSVVLEPEPLALFAEIFWELHENDYPFQIGGQETGAIPLVSAVVLYSRFMGKPVNGFFIRKSRKHTGLQKVIEGAMDNTKIILVDDLIHTGRTVLRQVELLESLGKKVHGLFTLIHFYDLSTYDFLRGKSIPNARGLLESLGKKVHGLFTLINFRDAPASDFLQERNIRHISLFSLKDFDIELKKKREKYVVSHGYKISWHFKSGNPNYFYVVPKSAPVLDEKKLFFGSDSGNFWALHQDTGEVAWKYKVGFHPKGKNIFSSPVVHDGMVFFGSYDGNVYALDTETGKPRWIFMEADWVGSSPAVADDLGLLFIGLEFSLVNKRGGIVALDIKTGEKRWSYTIPKLVHCSPAYSQEKKYVAIGGNDSIVYMFAARNGELLWRYKTGGEIKSSLAFDTENNLLVFGSFDGNLYLLDLESGALRSKFETQAPIYSIPLIYKNHAVFSSLDKKVYNLDLKTRRLKWEFATSGRVFASPMVIDGKILVGSNDGRLYEINFETGQLENFFQVTERITNKIAYNKKTKTVFLPTYANEIYCLNSTLSPH